MGSPVKLSPRQGNAHFKTTIDEASITWTIDNFLEWASSKEPGFTLSSPIFSFDLGGSNARHKISLDISPKGEKIKGEADYVALYLFNKRNEKMSVKATFKLLTKDNNVLSKHEFPEYYDMSTEGRGWPKFITMKNLEKAGLLPDDPLTIHCNISVRRSESSAVKYHTTPLPDKHPKTVLSDFAQMLADQAFSDFEIVCQDKSFPCHKAVLAARSEVFKTMLNNDGEEAKKNCLVIEDFENEEVGQLLQFIYTGILKEDDAIGTELLLLADKYDLPDLVNLCEVALAKDITLETCLGFLDITNRISSKYLIKLCSAFVAEHRRHLMTTSEWTRIAKENPLALISVLEEML